MNLHSALLQILLLCCLSVSQAMAGQKSVIGQTAWIEVGSLPTPYLARIDTGARITSIHAFDVEIENGSDRAEANIGRRITFSTTTRSGETQRMNAVIKKVSTVTNSQGREQRYVIELPLSWNHVQKTVKVNLRDRTKMTYKLLIGRNWLSHDFLVDVDMKAKNNGENNAD